MVWEESFLFSPFSNLVPPYTKLHKSVSNMKSWFISLPNKHCKQSQISLDSFLTTWCPERAYPSDFKPNRVHPIHSKFWSKTSSITIRARATQKMGDVVAKGPNQKTQKLNDSFRMIHSTVTHCWTTHKSPWLELKALFTAVWAIATKQSDCLSKLVTIEISQDLLSDPEDEDLHGRSIWKIWR